jgi:hypothetical protein
LTGTGAAGPVYVTGMASLRVPLLPRLDQLQVFVGTTIACGVPVKGVLPFAIAVPPGFAGAVKSPESMLRKTVAPATSAPPDVGCTQTVTVFVVPGFSMPGCSSGRGLTIKVSYVGPVACAIVGNPKGRARAPKAATPRTARVRLGIYVQPPGGKHPHQCPAGRVMRITHGTDSHLSVEAEHEATTTTPFLFS